MRECEVYWLGRVEYGDALRLQRERAAARICGDVEDCLLLVEHPPVITLGRGAKREHLLSDEHSLKARGIEVWETERGGDVTFHGPGQLVGYPVVDLTEQGKDLHLFMRKLEEMLIRTLETYDIRAKRSPGQTGVWVQGAKIASIGVHVSRWVSRHGFALNVSPDLSLFDLIVSCGIQGIRMTSMTSLLPKEVPIQAVAESVALEFGRVFVCFPRWKARPEVMLSLP
ncbi:MAG: lipoyl(octanoyl) transferase LipB [Candidatus Methylomirabilales bacterium]